MAQLNSLVVTGNSKFINDVNANTINLSVNSVGINFRPTHSTYYTTTSYQTSGNEALVFASKNAVTSFMFVNGEDSITNHGDSRWRSLTPGLQVKNNCVSIGQLIDTNVTPSYKLNVYGTGRFADKIYAEYKSNTYVNSLTASAINIPDNSTNGFGGWICGPTKTGRIAIATYQGADEKLYFGWGARGRTENSYEKVMTWEGSTGYLTANKFIGPLQGNADTATTSTYAEYFKLHASNEIRLYPKPSSATDIHFGYIWADNTSDAKINSYIFENGNKSLTDIKARYLKGLGTNTFITGSGTVGSDAGSSADPRYFPSKWTFNTGHSLNDGDVITIKIPCAGHDYGVFVSIDNGTTYKPVSLMDAGRLTTHFSSGRRISLIYEADGATNDVIAAAGANGRSNITGGCWRVLNFYNTNNTYNFSGTTFVSGNQNTAEHNCSNTSYNGIYYYTSNGPSKDIGATTDDGALHNQAHSTNWQAQIAQDYRDGDAFVRGKNSNNWTQWKKLLCFEDAFGLYYTVGAFKFEPITRKIITIKSSNAWDAQVYSAQGYSNNCILTFKAGTTGQAIMVGLDANPSEDANYTKIDFAFYLTNDTTNKTVQIFESGSNVGNFGAYAVGTEFTIEYSAGYVRYYVDGTLKRSIARSISGKLYLDSCIHGNGSIIYDFDFRQSLTKATTAGTADATSAVKDIGNSTNTTFAYSKAGLNYADYTWLAGWNGYELRAINKNQFAQASHTHSVSDLTWVAPANLTCTATANSQEWSIDLRPDSYTGTYWHVWSGPNSKSILACYTDDNSVQIPNGTLTVKNTTYSDYYGSPSSVTARLTSLNFTGSAAGTGKTKVRFDLVSSSVTTGAPPADTNKNSSGYLHTYMWDSGTNAMSQLYIPNGDHITSTQGPQGLMIRGQDNGTWKDWVKIPFFTAAITTGQVLISDGTMAGIKSSGYTIAKSVPSNAVFTDANVTQTATSTSAAYEVLFSVTADNTTRTEGVRKNSNLLFNPSTGMLYGMSGVQATNFGISATDGTSGGISLYNGVRNNGVEEYGLAFRKTSNMGTHGYVTSDWATYLTMSNTNNRGWVFRRYSSGNVASIDTNGRAVFNSSVTVGNTTNGGRMEYNSTNHCIDFIVT